MTACEQHGTTTSGRFQHTPGLRIAVVQGSAPDDWRDVYERLNTSSRQLAAVLTKASAAAAAFAGIAAVSGFHSLAILKERPDISPHYLACAVLLPGLLAGAAAAQFAGNLFLTGDSGADGAPMTVSQTSNRNGRLTPSSTPWRAARRNRRRST